MNRGLASLLSRSNWPRNRAGGRAVKVDAETGETDWADPPGWTSRYFSQAHFLFFTGPLQQPLPIGSTAALLVLLATGPALAWRRVGSARAQ